MCAKPIQLTTMPLGEHVPCGICLECRSKYRRHWAVRAMHEASLHEENMYGTLTYEDKFLPKHGSLAKRDHQLFMKKFRQRLLPLRVKYYLAGEYGEENGRPHYHFLLFGFRPRDLVPVVGAGQFPLYDSAMVSGIWEMGIVRVGDVSFASANYVAGYVLKKVDKVGKRKRWSVDERTGEAHEIQAEYSAMSRGGRPVGGVKQHGLGHGWFEKYGDEVERLGTIRVDDKEIGPPRYYDELVRERDQAAHEVMKLRRARKAGRRYGPDMRPIDVIDEERREAMAREVIARRRLEDAQRRL